MSERELAGAGGLAPLITVLSASGGVGKSSLALMAGHLAARAGIDTVLLEADLQFGDMGFWLGLDDELSTLAQGRDAQALQVEDRLRLYKAPCFPEVAEDISDEVAGLVPSLRGTCDLLIADTGAFWSGLTADLALASDVLWLVCDARPSSVAGAVRAGELCRRLGVASARCMCVYNRWSPKARLSAQEAQQALDVGNIHCVADGKALVDELLCTGDLEELVVLESPFARGVDALLAATLPRLGRIYAGMPQARKGGWFR